MRNLSPLLVIEDKAAGTQLIQDLKADGIYAITAYQPPSGTDKIMTGPVERIEEADMRRDERRRADDVVQPLAEFAQLRAVLDLDKDGPERRNDHQLERDTLAVAKTRGRTVEAEPPRTCASRPHRYRGVVGGTVRLGRRQPRAVLRGAGRMVPQHGCRVRATNRHQGREDAQEFRRVLCPAAGRGQQSAWRHLVGGAGDPHKQADEEGLTIDYESPNLARGMSIRPFHPAHL